MNTISAWRGRFPGRAFCISFLLFLLFLPAGARAQKVPVVERTLSNGMKLLMVPRRDEPTVAGGWVAHVGSSNERPGITGIAHLFEHMMFKGTPTIGTTNYALDVKIIQEQERVRDLMREEERKMRVAYRRGEIDDVMKPENMTPRWRELEKEFAALIARQREILVKNEFDLVYTSAGGTGMNAFTTPDLTAYFIQVPANKLELWMWMESERLFHPVFREFYAERDVVFEERRMRTDATPLGKMNETFEAMFWESHPYTWPVIGWPSDIPAITKPQADEFYGIYYAPQNISAVLVGDFDVERAVTLAEKYFGRIPRGPKEAPDVVTLEVKQPAEKRMLGEAEANPQVDILWHTVPFQHRDSYVLEVLAQLLSTVTGRLHQGLVLGRGVATEIWAHQDARKWAGVFNAGAEVKDGRTPAEAEQAVYAEIDRLKSETVPAAELQKVKNNFAAQEYRRLSANMPILMQIIFTDGRGDWKEINEAGKKIQAVTAADIQRVAREYFTRDNRAVAVYTRKAATSNAAAPAGLSKEEQQMLQAMQAKIAAEKDPAKLRQQLGAVEKGLEEAPEARKGMLRALRDVVQKRIGELEKK